MTQIFPYNDKYHEQTISLVLKILEDEMGYKNLPRPDLQKIPEFYQTRKGNFWLAIENEKVIGTIALKNYQKGRGLIKRMYVKKDMRKKGIGQDLLNTLLNFAKKSAYQKIYCTTVTEFTAARNFYKKNNFIEIAKLPEDIDTGSDNIFLELNF